MTTPRISLDPDTRKRRIPTGELRQDAGEEYAESRLPTVRAFRDARGWCLVIDGVPFRSRAAFADDRDMPGWNSAATSYTAYGGDS